MKTTNYDSMKDLIDIILSMNKDDLRRLRNTLVHMQTDFRQQKLDLSYENTAQDKDKQQLIGYLPYVLLDRKYFPTNNLLVTFAMKNLRIRIKSSDVSFL